MEKRIHPNQFGLLINTSFAANDATSRDLVKKIKALAHKGHDLLVALEAAQLSALEHAKQTKRLEKQVSLLKGQLMADKGERNTTRTQLAYNAGAISDNKRKVAACEVYLARLNGRRTVSNRVALLANMHEAYGAKLSALRAHRSVLLETARSNEAAINTRRDALAKAVSRLRMATVSKPNDMHKVLLAEGLADARAIDAEILDLMKAYNAHQLMDIEAFKKASNDARSRAGRAAKKQNQIRMKRESSAVHATRNTLDSIVVNSRGARPDQCIYDDRKRPKAKRYGSK